MYIEVPLSYWSAVAPPLPLKPLLLLILRLLPLERLGRPAHRGSDVRARVPERGAAPARPEAAELCLNYKEIKGSSIAVIF